MFDTILARDIRQTLDDFRRSVDQLFSGSYGSAAGTGVASPAYAFVPAVETFWTENELFLRAIVPGVTDKDVNVTVQNGQIVLEGERKLPEGWGDENARTQIGYGKFYFAIPVPNGLDLDKVSCRLHDGVLDIQVPVAEQMKPRQIPIEAGESHKAVAASA